MINRQDPDTEPLIEVTTENLIAPSIDHAEVAYFEKLAHRWWDTEGPFWPLHRLNAFRTGFLRERLSRAFGSDPAAERPLAGLRLLDIGCGGGILSEALARLGAQVTGIDVVARNIRVAQLHAQGSGLELDYRLVSAEVLAVRGERFDAVLNMEVVEHVEDLPAFLTACGRLVRPGGIMVVATINRTLVAFLIAILGAEYVLGWMPKGTHHWRKLVRPAEVTGGLGDPFELVHSTGVRINPFDRSFHHTPYLGVNYMLLLQRRLD
jgi:2-polyprenyl-6-hydroxyphenyl methylase / 3-demethylubiquinone-9 3-methyltransferase